MEVTDKGMAIHLERKEFIDLVRALSELDAMRAKFKYPNWANGYDMETADRVRALHTKLMNHE